MSFYLYIKNKFKDAKFNSDNTKARITCINNKCEDYWKNSKHKLNISFENSMWHCFRCGLSGKGLKKFRELYEGIKLKEFKLEKVIPVNTVDIFEEALVLPENIINISESKMATNYLKKRKIDNDTIIKFRLGFTITGKFNFRIILPSYNSKGKLIYFSGRSIFDTNKKVLNADSNKSGLLYGREYLGNNERLVIVEGAFDCLTMRKDCVALFSKFATKEQLLNLKKLDFKKYYVMLDLDARKEALELCLKLYNMGKEVYLVEMPLDNSDPNDMGFEMAWDRVNNYSKLITLGFIFNEQIKLRISK